MADWVTGKVTKVQNWTDALFSLTVHAPINPFTAGQFTKLGLEIDGERVQRAYSYVNAPDNPNLEFYLVTVPQGKLSPRLAALNLAMRCKWSATRRVSLYWMKCLTARRYGCWQPEPLLARICLFCNMARMSRALKIWSWYAARFAADLSYLPLMLELQQRYEGKLRIQTVVSRERVPGSLTGRVPALIENGELEKAVGLPMDKETSHVMLCGNPQMVRDTQQLLKETRQMTKHLRRRPGHMTAEHYW